MTYTPARPGGDAYAIVSPPIYLNLHLMFMANFAEKNYSEGLAAISVLISFFQQRPYFTPSNTPELQPGIDKLTLEMENLTPVDVNYGYCQLAEPGRRVVEFQVKLLLVG